MTYYFFSQFLSLIYPRFTSFSRGLSFFVWHRSKWIKVASRIISFFYFQTKVLSCHYNYSTICFRCNHLESLIFLFMDDQTVIFSGMYSRKPRNFLKKYRLNGGTGKENRGKIFFYIFWDKFFNFQNVIYMLPPANGAILQIW